MVSQPPPGLAGIIIFTLAAARAGSGSVPATAIAAMDLRKVSLRIRCLRGGFANPTMFAAKAVNRLSERLGETLMPRDRAAPARLCLLRSAP